MKKKVNNVSSEFEKINACITERQFNYIEEERLKRGISFSEMLRRILDEFLDDYKNCSLKK